MPPSPYENVTSSYTALREPLEVPCRFSFGVLDKLLSVVSRLIRLAFFLPNHTIVPYSSSVTGSAKDDDLEHTESLNEGNPNISANLNSVPPLSLHSQLAISMQRLQNVVRSLRAPLAPLSSGASTASNSVLNGYVQYFMEQKGDSKNRRDLLFTQQCLSIDARTRLLDKLYDKIPATLWSAKNTEKSSVALSSAIVIEDMFPFEIQRLALCSGQAASHIRVLGQKGSGAPARSDNRLGALAALESLMNTLSCGLMSDAEARNKAGTDATPQEGLFTGPSTCIYLVSTGGTLVSFSLLSVSESDVGVLTSEPHEKYGSTLHFASVADAACLRFSSSQCGESKKQNISDYIMTINDIYARPTKNSFEFNSCASSSHQTSVPFLPQIYYDKVPGCAPLYDIEFQESIEIVGTSGHNGNSVYNHDLLMTCALEVDYAYSIDELEALLPPPPRTAELILKTPEKNTGGHPHSVPISARPVQSPAVGSSLKKFDVAVPVALAFKSANISSSKQSTTARKFKMKTLIPKKLRSAFSQQTVSGSMKNVSTRNVDVVPNSFLKFAKSESLRRADWASLLSQSSLFELKQQSEARGETISTNGSDSTSKFPEQFPHKKPRWRLDALYTSYRFHALFVRLHTHTRQFSGHGSGMGGSGGGPVSHSVDAGKEGEASKRQVESNSPAGGIDQV